MFDGKFSVTAEGPEQISMSWKDEDLYAVLNANFKAFQFEIRYWDAIENCEKTLEL